MKVMKVLYKWRINRLEEKIGQIKDKLERCEYCKRNHLLNEEELDWYSSYVRVEMYDIEQKLEKIKEKYERQ